MKTLVLKHLVLTILVLKKLTLKILMLKHLVLNILVFKILVLKKYPAYPRYYIFSKSVSLNVFPVLILRLAFLPELLNIVKDPM